MKKNRKRLVQAPPSGEFTLLRSGPARRGRRFDDRNEDRGHESPVNGATHLPMRCQFPAALHRASGQRGEELRTVSRTMCPPSAIPHGGPTRNIDNGRRPLPHEHVPTAEKQRFPEIPPTRAPRRPRTYPPAENRSKNTWPPKVLCREYPVEIFSAFEREQAANPQSPLRCTLRCSKFDHPLNYYRLNPSSGSQGILSIVNRMLPC